MEKWLYRIKRWLFAKPVVMIDDDVYVISWFWKNGLIEVVGMGYYKPGDVISHPKNARVLYGTNIS